jgi:hypothetical protein
MITTGSSHACWTDNKRAVWISSTSTASFCKTLAKKHRTGEARSKSSPRRRVREGALVCGLGERYIFLSRRCKIFEELWLLDGINEETSDQVCILSCGSRVLEADVGVEVVFELGYHRLFLEIFKSSTLSPSNPLLVSTPPISSRTNRLAHPESGYQ